MALIVTKSSAPEDYSFHKVSKNNVSSSDKIRLLDWLKEYDLVYLQSEKISTETGVTHQEVIFCLTGNAADYFPLLRSIAAVGHGSAFRLQVNSKLKSFTFRYGLQDEAEAGVYLSKVLNLVRKELRFKQVLRKIIYNQDKFRREEKLLLGEMTA